jgi:hypothetical protein
MLWLGLFGVVIMAIAGLISRNRVRGWIRRHTNKEVDRWCDDLAVIFIFIGGLIAIGTMVNGYFNLNSTRRDLLVTSQDLQNNNSTLQATQQHLSMNQTQLTETNAELQEAKQYIETLRDEKENLENLKQTSPNIDAVLTISNDNKFIIVIKTLNSVPFEYMFSITNRDGTFVHNNLQFDWSKLHPAPGRSYVRHTSHELKNVKEDYVILHLSYRSVYAAEFNYPPHLVGQIEHVYRIPNEWLIRGQEQGSYLKSSVAYAACGWWEPD